MFQTTVHIPNYSSYSKLQFLLQTTIHASNLKTLFKRYFILKTTLIFKMQFILRYVFMLQIAVYMTKLRIHYYNCRIFIHFFVYFETWSLIRNLLMHVRIVLCSAKFCLLKQSALSCANHRAFCDLLFILQTAN